MKTTEPKAATMPDHAESVASKASATSSASPDEGGTNPMSDKGYDNTPDALSYSDVHCEPSTPGKFDFGFMKDSEGESYAKPVHASGSYPVASGSESAYAKPVQPAGSLVPGK